MSGEFWVGVSHREGLTPTYSINGSPDRGLHDRHGSLLEQVGDTFRFEHENLPEAKAEPKTAPPRLAKLFHVPSSPRPIQQAG